MDTRMDGSVLAVLAAYQKISGDVRNMMTSQVVKCLPTLKSGKYDS